MNITQGDIDSGIGLGMSFFGRRIGHQGLSRLLAISMRSISPRSGPMRARRLTGTGCILPGERTNLQVIAMLVRLEARHDGRDPDLTLPSWVAKTVESRNPVAINDMRTDFQGRLAEIKRQLADPNTMQPWNIEANVPGIENILKALDHVEAGAKLTPTTVGCTRSTSTPTRRIFWIGISR